MSGASEKKQDAAPPEFTHVARPHTDALQFAVKSIVVKVGKPAITFHVDEKLISNASPFFAAALKKEWREAQTRVVNLPEEKPCSFNIYLNWLYRRQIYLDIATGDSRQHGAGRRWFEMIDAYARGEMLLDTDFKDAVCDSLAMDLCTPAEGIHIVPHQSTRRTLYRQTKASSKLRKLLAYRMSQLPNSEMLAEDDDSALLFDIAKLKLDGADGGPRGEANVRKAVGRCEFHEHEAGEDNCYRKKYANITTLRDED